MNNPGESRELRAAREPKGLSQARVAKEAPADGQLRAMNSLSSTVPDAPAKPAAPAPRPQQEPTSAAHRRRFPASIGDYQLLRRIGKGGRSYVFAARQRLVERTVALKVLRPDLVGQQREFIAFKREAAAYGRCDHPHILTCHQAGQDGEWHFMALAHAEYGDTIQALSGTSRRKGVQRVLTWCAQMAEAVDHLVQRGYVHGDIKPANILVGADDRALLADLGSLHPLHDDGEAQRFEGTAAYMSPEQARRERLSPLTDIYSIGASAWHLVSGKAPRPVCEDKREALRRAIEEPLPALSTVAPWVASGVAAVIERCINPDPALRYQRPSELAQAARQVLSTLSGDESDSHYPAINLEQGF